MKALITGGAGFIGLQLARRLLQDGYDQVYIYDNFSGSERRKLEDSGLVVIEDDLRQPRRLEEALAGSDIVFHLAANPDVRSSHDDPKAHFEDNVLATFNLLEALKSHPDTELVFTSTSTVYGEGSRPWKETDSCMPISVYGASKLASEAMIMGYVGSGLLKRALILRLANIIGPTSTHGIIYDLINKLRRDPDELEILGDGKQEKSYLFIEDTLDAIMVTVRWLDEQGEGSYIFNVGSNDTIKVDEIVKIVLNAMGVTPKIRYRLEYGGRGWPGDVRQFILDTSKLMSIGWKQKHNSIESVKLTVNWILNSKQDK